MMKVLSVCLTLFHLLTPTLSVPVNSTNAVGKYTRNCEQERQQCSGLLGSYCPECDANGNFLPRQCWGSTGYCWCVNTITGVEIPNTQTRPGELPVDCGIVIPCPWGWSYYGERCYTFINSSKTWADAEIYCRFDQASLASIHSDEENHFIMGLTRGDTHDFPETWIGGVAPVLPGYWLWSDGSEFNYDNFFNNGINTPNKTCLKINYGYNFKWFYDACSASFPFVCSKLI